MIWFEYSLGSNSVESGSIGSSWKTSPAARMIFSGWLSQIVQIDVVKDSAIKFRIIKFTDPHLIVDPATKEGAHRDADDSF